MGLLMAGVAVVESLAETPGRGSCLLQSWTKGMYTYLRDTQREWRCDSKQQASLSWSLGTCSSVWCGMVKPRQAQEQPRVRGDRGSRPGSASESHPENFREKELKQQWWQHSSRVRRPRIINLSSYRSQNVSYLTCRREREWQPEWSNTSEGLVKSWDFVQPNQETLLEEETSCFLYISRPPGLATLPFPLPWARPAKLKQ